MSGDPQKRESEAGSAGNLEELYERFEQGWKKGPPPDLIEFLGQAPPDRAPEVFDELLGIELEYRFHRREQFNLEEYIARFPQFGQRIEAIYSESRQRAEEMSAPTPKPGPLERTALHISCPHCQYPIEILDDRSLKDLSCPICGSGVTPLPSTARHPQNKGAERNAIAHFELLEVVGQGTFGRVWKAHDKKTDRIVALKIPRISDLEEDEYERFISEARSAARCQHPHIVTVYEVGFEENDLFIASQFIEGKSLREHLALLPEHRIEPRQAAQLCIPIAEALHHAHEAGVVHRDLKPANILLDANHKPYVTDFGLAKRDSAELSITRSGMVVGTVQYMSPEQARGEKSVGRGSDIYSLGTMLFELLTGEKPFRGTTETIFRQLADDEPPSLRKLNPQIHPDLEAVCLRCLEKNPANRFATSQNLADDLQRYLSGHPTHSRPITSLESCWRWCCRKPLVASLLAVTAALILVITTGSLIWGFRESNRRVIEANQRKVEENLRKLAETAEQQAIKNLADSNYQAARLAGERGQWKLALEKYDLALDQNPANALNVRMNRLTAYDALQDDAAWMREIDSIGKLPGIESRRGELMLWEAQRLRLEGKDEKGLQLFRNAIKTGLQPADEEYAKAMIAETTPEAEEHLEKALKIYPFHRFAKMEYVVLLLFRGKSDLAQREAITGSEFFPDDPMFPYCLALVAAFQKDYDQKEVDRLIEKCSAPFDIAMKKNLREIADYLRELHRLMNYDDLDKISPFQMATTVFKTSKLLTQSKIKILSRVPHSAKKAGDLVLKSFDLLNAWKNPTIFQSKYLSQAVEVHPEGTLLTLLAHILFVENKLDEAEKAALLATKTPSLVPDFTRHAYDIAGGAAATKYALNEKKNPEDLDRAVQYFLEAARRGSLRPDAFDIAIICAKKSKQYDSVREIYAEIRKRRPNDFGLLYKLVEFELEMGNSARALDYALEGISKDPKSVPFQEIKTKAYARMALETR